MEDAQLRHELDLLDSMEHPEDADALVEFMRGTYTVPDDTILPTPCNDIAPSVPNVYSDGGLDHPSTPEWSLGSYGVYWPGRQLQDKPATQAELEYATIE